MGQIKKFKLTEIKNEEDVDQEFEDPKPAEGACLEAVSVGDHDGMIADEGHGKKVP